MCIQFTATYHATMICKALLVFYLNKHVKDCTTFTVRYMKNVSFNALALTNIII